MRLMRGSGGLLGGGAGGGGGGTTISPDDLSSRDWMEALIGLCEGPIEGLLDNDLRNLYVGDTPLLDESGAANFTQLDGGGNTTFTFSADFAPGIATPDPFQLSVALHDYGSSETTNVGTNLAQGVPVVRQTTSGQIDFIDIRLVFNALYEQQPDGTFDADFDFTWEIKALSASTWTVLNGGVPLHTHGKTTQRFVKQFRAPVARIGEPYVLRVTRDTPDNDPHHIASVTFESFQEVIATPRAYPYTALCHLLGQPTNQFSSVPPIWGIYKGFNQIKIPTNYDPVAKTYAGDWDGTFKLGWTDNNAWVLYDLVTNDRYGMSKYTPLTMDKFEVYDAGQWCDQQVPSQVVGQTEPRYTFNMLIAQQQSVQEMVRYVAGTFNAAVFDDFNGSIQIRVDKDDTAVALFTPESVEEGGFHYSYTDITSRYNEITVAFANPDQKWIVDRRLLTADKFPAIAAAQEANGLIPLDFVAVGCISEDEAIRRAYYKFLTANTEVEMVTFRTNRMALFVQGFEIILIADPLMGYALSGRAKTYSTDRQTVHLRDPLFLETGVSYKVQFMGAQGVEQYDLAGATAGYNTSLVLTTALSAEIPDLASFAVVQDGAGIGAPKPYRVVTINEVDGNPDLVEITALEVNRNKWLEADTLKDLGTPIYSFKPAFQVAAPTNFIAVQESVPGANGGLVATIKISWDPSSSQQIQKYRAMWRHNTSDNFQLFTETAQTSAQVINADSGYYEFALTAVNLHGSSSSEVRAHLTVVPAQYLGNLPRVSGLELEGQGNDTEFVGRDPKFDWRVNFPVGYEHFDGKHGANTVAADLQFKAFQIQIFDPVTGALVRTETVTNQTYVYTYEKNANDPGGPRRDFRIEVSYESTLNQFSPAAKLEVSNPAPAKPTGLLATAGFAAIVVSWDRPIDTDYVGTLIYSDTVNPPTISETNLKYDGPAIPGTFQADPTVDHYVVVVHYDAFGRVGLNYSDVIVATAAFAPHTEQPGQPTGLALATAIASDGTISVTATWNANPEAVVDHYDVAISPDGVTYQESVVAATSYTWNGLTPAGTYYTEVRAVDIYGNRSAFCTPVSITAAHDTTPPAAATSLTVVAGFQSLFLNWVNPTDQDFSHEEIWESTDNVIGHATHIADAEGTAFARLNITSGATRYYWIRAVDTSGNPAATYTGPVSGSTATLNLPDFPSTFMPIKIAVGIPSGAPTDGNIYSYDPTGNGGIGTLYKWNGTAWDFAIDMAQITGAITTTQITPGAVTTPKLAAAAVTANELAANSVVAGKIAAAAVTATTLAAANVVTLTAQIQDGIITNAKIADLDAAKITAGTVLSGSVTVSGTALSTTTSNAANPASVVNAGSTLINPGNILISGSTALSNWLWGTDATKIDGGVIGTNTILATSLKISNRQVQFPDLHFQSNAGSNSVLWTSGTVNYLADNGSITSASISSGSVSWSSGVLYLYWVKGATTISSSTSISTAAAADNIIVATYNGTAGLIVNYGMTIVDGSNITAGTISGDRVIANTLDGNTILANSLSAASIKTSTLSAVEIDVSAGAGNVVISGASNWIKVADSGHDLVWLGALPGGGHGIQIKDASGNLILSSGSGIPNSAVNGLGPFATSSSISHTDVTGLGAFALLNQIDPINSSTYIASASIAQAHIIDLAVDTIKIAHGGVSDHAVAFTANGSTTVTFNDTGVLVIDFSCVASGLNGTSDPVAGSVFARYAASGVTSGAHLISVATTNTPDPDAVTVQLSIDAVVYQTRVFRVSGMTGVTSLDAPVLLAQAFYR